MIRSSVKTSIRNGLVGAGAYYLATWILPSVVLVFAPITNRSSFSGDFEYVVLMPLVNGAPMMLVAAGTGATTAWLVDATYRWRWALLPAVLFATFNWLGSHWVRPPYAIDHAAAAVRAALPVLACLLAAVALDRRERTTSTNGHAV